ncbi:hypothetical protein ACGFOU_21360 [Streptomyces sp. NPDC048595]|uniref:hypothetical protein n=1 Tax=Streptomyces sp. NPDC048595 TaxID=3365576 RepID=UPI003722B2E8
MTQPELPDMGDPVPREGLPPWKQRFYEYALVVIGLLAPWAFLWVAATRNVGLLWIPVLNLLGTYAGLYVMVRGWRGRSRRMFAVLAGVVVCWIVCTELFRRLN